MISLIVPWVGGNPEALKRTIESTKGLCRESIVVHQKMFDDDEEVARGLADKVVVADWNAVFQEGGFALLPNYGAASATGPWCLLLGVGETVAELYRDIPSTLNGNDLKTIYRCNHHNDVHDWGRLWNPSAGPYWSGSIHEEAGNGIHGPVIFRMQDTPKEPHEDTFRNECIKWWKNCSYHANYFYLLNNPDKRGFTNEGWLKFVSGARESIEDFVETNKDLMEAAWEGDRDAFYEGVNRRMDDGRKPDAVNHAPLGEPMTEGALPSHSPA